MNGSDRQALAQARQEGVDTETQGQRVLAVDIAPDLVLALPRNVLHPGLDIRTVTIDSLPQERLSGPAAPVLILSLLVTPGFDALDLARLLSENGYRGRYLALVDRLPNPTLIRREVAAQSPGVNFDVIILDGSSPLHSL
jgi:hypothetical protein